MRRPKPFKFLSSVFTKLLLIILIAGLGINLAVIFLFGAFRHHVANNYEPHLTRYVTYLAKELGSPPSLARAKRLAAGTNMVITYDSTQTRWRTATRPFTIEDREFHIFHDAGGIQVGGHRGRFIITVRQDAGRLTLYFPYQADAEKKIKVITMALVFYITLLMVVAFWSIRRVLRPLGWLKQGVDRVSRGDLDHRVPLKGSSELQDLSYSFNTMTERLQLLMRSKEQLLLDVSHELRTPITRLKVALAMMPDTEEKKGLEEDLKEMEQKISELLETARALKIKASLNTAPVPAGPLLREVASQLAAGRPAINIAPLPPGTPELIVDREQLAKAIKNIVENAQKFSDDDGPPVQMELSLQGDNAVIRVTDQGVGIAPEDLDFIFEPFYRVDKARTPRTGGYGLGLSLAKTIIDAHGGRIDVRSTPGQGTTVSMHIPLLPPDNASGSSP